MVLLGRVCLIRRDGQRHIQLPHCLLHLFRHQGIAVGRHRHGDGRAGQQPLGVPRNGPLLVGGETLPRLRVDGFRLLVGRQQRAGIALGIRAVQSVDIQQQRTALFNCQVISLYIVCQLGYQRPAVVAILTVDIPAEAAVRETGKEGRGIGNGLLGAGDVLLHLPRPAGESADDLVAGHVSGVGGVCLPVDPQQGVGAAFDGQRAAAPAVEGDGGRTAGQLRLSVAGDPAVVAGQLEKALPHRVRLRHVHDIYLCRQTELRGQQRVGTVGIIAQNVFGRRGVAGSKGSMHHDHIVGIPGDIGLLFQRAAVKLRQTAAEVRRHRQQHNVVARRSLPFFAVSIGGKGGILGHLLQIVREIPVAAVGVRGGPEGERKPHLLITLRLRQLDAQLVDIAAHGQQLGGAALAVLPDLGVNVGVQRRFLCVYGEVCAPGGDDVLLLHEGQRAFAAAGHGIGQEADGHHNAGDNGR